MSEDNLLDIRNATVEFQTSEGPLRALEAVDLSVAEGEFVCVVGPSGCGKTTLLNLVAGFSKPSSGTVFFGGKPVKKPESDRGIVFQRPSLYPWLNVRQNVEFGLRMRGIEKKKRHEVSKHFLGMVKLWEFRESKPYELSGGMQQRVAVARVLANDSRLLLMDEPLGALDALTREHMQDELLRIWRDTRKTFFFITHDVEEAVYLATTIIVMSPRPGRIIERIEPPFSRDFANMKTRAIKSHRDFVKMREEVLQYIWH
ncbi:MAG: ABC transporter ATP-binding protein [Candidatus Sumerlaeia bacterium]